MKISNAYYLKRLIFLCICVAAVLGIFGPFIFFPLYLGRYPKYEFNDLLSLISIEIFIVFGAILFIYFMLKGPWEIELSNRYLILKNIWKHEKKYLCKNIIKIDKIEFNNEGLKTWAIIGKKPYENERYGNKIALYIGDELGQKLKSSFEQYKQN